MKRNHTLLVVGFSLLVTVLLYLSADPRLPGHPEFDEPWDHHKYIFMARSDPFNFHIAPFGWRIGLPLLVKVLPFSLQWNFLLVALLSGWMTGVVFYLLLRAWGFEKRYSFVGLLMFYAMGFGVKKALEVFWRPDALALFLLVLALYFISMRSTRGDLAFAAVLAAGVMVKESALFVAPLYYTLRAHRWLDWRLAVRALLLSLPAVVVLVIIRLAIPAWNDDPSYIRTLPETLWQVQLGSSRYDLLFLFQQIGLSRLRELSLSWLLRFTVGTFTVVGFLLPFFDLRTNARWLLRFAPFLLLVYAQLLFAVNNERLLISGFPAVIVLALNGIKRLCENTNLSPGYFLAYTLLLLGLVLSRPYVFVVPYDLEALLLILFLGIGHSLGIGFFLF